jgi:hypothetical protein
LLEPGGRGFDAARFTSTTLLTAASLPVSVGWHQGLRRRRRREKEEGRPAGAKIIERIVTDGLRSGSIND